MTKLVLKNPQFADLEPASVIHVIREKEAAEGKAELEAIAGRNRKLAGGSAAPD